MISSRALVSSAFLIGLASAAFGGDPPAAPASPGASGIGDSYFKNMGNGGYDALHYDLEFELDKDLKHLVGHSVMRAKAMSDLSSFNLDFHVMEVKSITVDGAPAENSREKDELTVTPKQPIQKGAEFTVEIRYEGQPEGVRSDSLGMEEMGWMSSPRGVFVVSEPEGAASLFPCNDHPLDKATYTIACTVPAPWVVASNGTPGPDVKNGDKTTYTFKPRDPMTSYLVTISIAEFDVEEGKSKDGVPLRYYFPKKLGEKSRASMRRTGDIIDFFSTIFGPYPFECSGGIVATIPIPGALENQTRPVYGMYATGVPIVAHELAHQWFGDNVSIRDWSQIWLAEGFAEYGAWLWLEHEEGEDALEDRVLSESRTVRARHVRPSGDPGAKHLFASESYNRGPLVLHALRRAIGDEAFFATLREWNEKYRYGNASIDDFIAMANAKSGRDVSVLMKAWLFDKVAPPIDEY